MNLRTNSVYVSAGSSLAPDAPSKLFEMAPAPDAIGAVPGILTILKGGVSLAARLFDGIAEQRDRQAKEIVAYYGQDRWSDSLERQIGDAPGRGGSL
jgi:hypothetical protein